MDERAKRRALRMVPYGLYIGGITDGEQDGFFLLTWLTQCSFKPPLFVAGIGADSDRQQAIEKSGLLAVNVLAEDQGTLAKQFLKGAEVADGKANGQPYSKRSSGAPVLDDVPAFWVGKLRAKLAGGDHAVYLFEVVDAGHRRDARALTHEIAGMHYAG